MLEASASGPPPLDPSQCGTVPKERSWQKSEKEKASSLEAEKVGAGFSAMACVAANAASTSRQGYRPIPAWESGDWEQA